MPQPDEVPLDYHFRGRRSDLRPLYERLLAELAKRWEFECQVGKTYIGLKHKIVFAALYIQTRKIVVELVARRQFNGARIRKVVQFAPNRWAHFIDVQREKDIDEQLLGWIGQAYE